MRSKWKPRPAEARRFGTTLSSLHCNVSHSCADVPGHFVVPTGEETWPAGSRSR
jgi:hypothetical protein